MIDDEFKINFSYNINTKRSHPQLGFENIITNSS